MKKQIFTKNRTPLLISFVLLSILTINLVSAFGVSSPVWRGNPLGVSPGKTGTVELTLQNMVGTEDVTVRVILKEGKEIAIVEEKDYLIKAGTKDTRIPVRVTIPQGTPLGTTYIVKVSFDTVTPGSSAVVLGTGMDTTFDVLVIEEPPQLAPAEEAKGKISTPLLIGIILAILIIIIIVIIVLRKKNKK